MAASVMGRANGHGDDDRRREAETCENEDNSKREHLGMQHTKDQAPRTAGGGDAERDKYGFRCSVPGETYQKWVIR
eukprot:762890-Hanusia_phi.AAC.8